MAIIHKVRILCDAYRCARNGSFEFTDLFHAPFLPKSTVST
jgi:hypothetical protein